MTGQPGNGSAAQTLGRPPWGSGLSAADFIGGQTPKHYLAGTHRARHPDETVDAVRPHLAAMGITRIANVTGLDRIGIPVVMVVRPNSRSLAVSQGKGLTLAAARASGVMESIELYHGERPDRPIWMESYQRLRDDVRVADPALLPFTRHSLYTPEWALPWVEAVDLVDGAAVWVPFELVHVNATVPLVPGSGCFLAGTNGLASGNNRAEAVLHALCEVVERDATALWELSPDTRESRRLDLSTVDDPVCRSLLEQYERADVLVMAWDTTSDVQIATFRVVILDRQLDAALRPVPAAGGFGCHPDRRVALSRALTEAAQSRLTQISGSRDDLTRGTYRATQDAGALETHRRIAREAGVVDFDKVPSSTAETVEGDIARVIADLRAIGIDHVLAVDLSRPGLPVSVVRVIVPGLEGPTESPWYTPGARARERAGARAAS
jgi:ribosomal protein S12 methylthiotransferase accessory factor